MQKAIIHGLLALLCLASASAEVMLQYFNTSWREVTSKMPELAEAGYDSLWLPPPTKGSGGLSVGYDCWDRFDLGGIDQRGSVSTRYGTHQDLVNLIKVAHRFGIKIYFDNVMNHNAFDVPGYNSGVPIGVYPGFVPEDFHLRVTEEGFYRKWDNTRNWGDAWQVMHLGLSDLIDIATEPGEWNNNFGRSEGSRIKKISFVRHPSNPEFYCYKPTGAGQTHAAGQGTYVGFGPNNGITVADLTNNKSFYSEYVESMLSRSARWQLAVTHCDGFRLDAVKHTPADFFGATYGVDRDSSDYGYTGQIQRQFNLTRGFSDSNHRDTVFDTQKPRDDAMLFGEHLGQPPSYESYINAGMRLVDNDLRNQMNSRLGNPWTDLNGFDQPGWGGFPAPVSVMHAQSHDNDFAARRELQHAFYFTRAGLPLVYTDGNYQAETLSQSGGAFPRHSNTNFLGQFGDGRLPNLAYIHQHFARGYQVGKWSDGDFIAYERIDKRENTGMSDSDGVTALIMLNDNYSTGVVRSVNSSFPHDGGTANDAYLWQYATGPNVGGFYTYASALHTHTVPAGGYFVYSWRTPEPALHWENVGGKPVTIYQNGQETGTITVTRRDGPDGDPGFNPHGVNDPDDTDYSYQIDIPRVTDGSNLKFVARADGSAENILLRLDGGIDLNGNGTDPAKRDNPPALTTEVVMGYEQPSFVHRQGAEKFAAKDTARCTIGSSGAETFTTTIGTGTVSVVNGSGNNPASNNTAAYFFHDPADMVESPPSGTPTQYEETSGDITFWAKSNGSLDGYQARLYYTTDASDPEGYGGYGTGGTKTATLTYSHDAGGGSWFSTTISPKPSGDLRYKISIFRTSDAGNPLASVFPTGPAQVEEKLAMMTVFEADNFNAETIQFFPHNDYEKTADQSSFVMQTGLDEGMHIVRGRAFLKRDNRASLFNTFQQTFYYDTKRPTGEIVFPAENDTLNQQSYGAVVRTDRSVNEVWFFIQDSESANDDAQTGASNGNGAGNWVRASEVPPTSSINSSYPKEWRFNFNNVPAGAQNAQLQVRLIEKSSNTTFTSTVSAADDLVNWYTTLTRNVTTSGPDTRMFAAFPAADAEVVAEGYTMKAYFSKALGNGKSDQELIDEFLITIASRVSGSTDGAVVQDRTKYSIVRNETADYHALSYTLPNLYNGQPDFLHHINITHNRGGVVLQADRKVKAAVVESTFLSINTPPAFDSDGKPYEVVLPAIANPTPQQRQIPIVIESDSDIVQLDIIWEHGSGNTALQGTEVHGGKKLWTYLWTGISEGYYRFRVDARKTNNGPLATTERRSATVIFRQILPENENDPDDDDDGLLDVDELTQKALPQTNAETWTNGDVHTWRAYGRSNPTTPDSDGDLLPDALEVGWGGVPTAQEGEAFQDTGYGIDKIGAGNQRFDWQDSNGNGVHDAGETSEPFTDSNADNVFDYGTIVSRDTDGDGTPNFKADLDPPFYNTVPDNNNLPNYDFNRGRTEQIHGSTTDPQNPDSDGDGIRDGIEDGYNPAWASGSDLSIYIHNGWIDGDGNTLDRNDGGKVWPNGKVDAGEVWLETDPNNPDSDGDGLSDGYGEDKDLNGLIKGDTNRNRIYDPGEAWAETNGLSKDSDGDGLLDGWETQNGLDPLDNGIDNLRTAASNDGDPAQGPTGDPDGDGFNNSQEQTSGTKPLVSDATSEPPANSIVIGPEESIMVGSTENHREFAGWTCDDLVAFDEYEGEGGNNQGGDIFPAGDGFDSSRDIVAFYARDGGADGNYYFRLDFRDLQPFAEEGNLDIYVVMDTGNTASGEAALPDQVDILTEMKWEVVAACYQGNNGRVYVDTNAALNTTSVNEDLTATGVQVRDQNSANGFGEAYYNADLDACEFSISRQALLDAGWNGSSKLRFQVFTTRDGTQNSGDGAGDLGGRNDIRDSVYDDWLSEDYWSSQDYVSTNGKLTSYMQVDGSGLYPDQCKRAKLILLNHANHALRPGSQTQDKINTGFGTGWHRSLDAHQAFGQPLSLHITPTLASAVQWASVDPTAGKPWLDGPAFNQRIAAMAQTGNLDLLGTTYADHMPSYFTSAYTQDSVELAAATLEDIYNTAPSPNVFWAPERVLDGDVLSKIGDAGFNFTFIDQMRHFWKWQGRQTAISEDGYRLNKYHGVHCFLINDSASTYRYQTLNNGLPNALRNLYHRKARSGVQDQVVILYHHWDELADVGNADAYDTNLRWVSNKPWIEVVTPSQIINGEVDVTRDGVGDTWFAFDRGSPALVKTSHDWLDHATQENYDHWYNGSPGSEEGLAGKTFNIRPGSPLSLTYGMQALNDGKLADATWDEVSAISLSGSRIAKLARGTAHSANMLTAFHEQQNNDISKYSTGDYIWVDSDSNNLSDFSKQAQSQMRHAAIYRQVDLWAASPPSVAVAIAQDIDLDGENEYILKNDRVFAVFEAIGGRLTHAWARDTVLSEVYQIIGNPLSYSGSETELEGDSILTGTDINAYRTSGFKDWFASGPETNFYVNHLYTVVASGSQGWTFTSADGKISKTIQLADNSQKLSAAYTLGGDVTKLYVRFGLSPHLHDLLINGQRNLSPLTDGGGQVFVRNSTGAETVTASVHYSSASVVSTATDKQLPAFAPDTVNLRNQALTQQVELESQAASFSLELELSAACADCDQDGLPDDWETANSLDPNDDGLGGGNVDYGASGDPDGDGLSNAKEHLLGLNPQLDDAHLFPKLTAIVNADRSVTLDFPTLTNRRYRLWWSHDLDNWELVGADILTLDQPADPHTQVLDTGNPHTHPGDEPRRFYRLQILYP
ncbi:MAG: alpha-amylase family glycosyl hydrolase [Akkermansiaceae bacterium]